MKKLSLIPHIKQRVTRDTIIKEGLNNKNRSIRRTAAKMIQYASEHERGELIRQCLENEDEDVRQTAAKMIQYALEHERGELIKIIKGTKAQTDIFNKNTHDLYQHDNMKGKTSTKSHHGATLNIGKKTLEGKAYQRIMPIDSGFRAQKKAQEAMEIRQSDEWDYIPVEPILSFSFHDPNHIRVTNKIMHTSLKEYMKTQEYYLRQKEINNMKEKIRITLKKIGIREFDNHAGNYAIQFPYSEDGRINTNACPRIYRIDRDTAEIS